ncbi:MAG: hypothetical protein K8H86_08645 [Ignavibacteriaceae bacterium]|nr:hypothetical protein [Ignavibacteriaceae bacterium]
MLLKNYLKNIISISLLLAGVSNAQVLFIPLDNQSGYKGVWKISEEVPNYLAAYLREFYQVQVLSSTAYQSVADDKSTDKSMQNDLEFIGSIAKDFGFQYAVTGKITKFDISRFIAGDLTVAGYESYSCNIEAIIQVYDLSLNAPVYSGSVVGEINDQALGITLLGKPTEKKEQYFNLNSIRFGGEEFGNTIVGETMILFCQNFAEEIENASPDFFKENKRMNVRIEVPDKTLDDITLNTEVLKGQILIYDESTGEAFINLGSANGLKPGEELAIYSKADSLFDPTTNEFLGFSDKKIANLEIIEVRAEKLSLAVVKSNREKVKKGMDVRKLFIKRRDK